MFQTIEESREGAGDYSRPRATSGLYFYLAGIFEAEYDQVILHTKVSDYHWSRENLGCLSEQKTIFCVLKNDLDFPWDQR